MDPIDPMLLTELGRGDEGNVGRLSKLLIEPGRGEEGSVGRLSKATALPKELELTGLLVVVLNELGDPARIVAICILLAKCTGIAGLGDIET